jgi:putative copper export protein
MNLVDILFNAASGGVVGSLLHLGTSWFETWQKGKQADVDIKLMNAQMACAEKKSAWDAFTASQTQQTQVQIIPGASPWCATIAELVDAFRAFTRPGLTWSLMVILLVVYLNSTVEVQSKMTPEILFASFTALFWWFGSRYSASK